MWPFNYPGDNYITNVFNQVITLLEDVKETTVEFIEKNRHSNHRAEQFRQCLEK